MTIEDIVLYLRLSRISIPTWDQQLVNSISDQFSQGLGLTEKQDTVVRRILKKHKDSKRLSEEQYITINSLIDKDRIATFDMPEKAGLFEPNSKATLMNAISQSKYLSKVEVGYGISENSLFIILLETRIYVNILV